MFDSLQTYFGFWINLSVLNRILVQSHNRVQAVVVGLYLHQSWSDLKAAMAYVYVTLGF